MYIVMQELMHASGITQNGNQEKNLHTVWYNLSTGCKLMQFELVICSLITEDQEQGFEAIITLAKSDIPCIHDGRLQHWFTCNGLLTMATRDNNCIITYECHMKAYENLRIKVKPI